MQKLEYIDQTVGVIDKLNKYPYTKISQLSKSLKQKLKIKKLFLKFNKPKPTTMVPNEFWIYSYVCKTC